MALQTNHKKIMNYQEFVNKTAGTCTHVVRLSRNGQEFTGIYNGLACWGEVWGHCNGKDAYGGLYEVIQLQTEWIEDDSEDECGYMPNFTLYDFIDAGFEIVNPPEWLKQNAQTVGA